MTDVIDITNKISKEVTQEIILQVQLLPKPGETELETLYLKCNWYGVLPEMPDYFALMKIFSRNGEELAEPVHLFPNSQIRSITPVGEVNATG